MNQKYLDEIDKKMNYKLVIYYQNSKLLGFLYENNNLICQSNDLNFWFKRYYSILKAINNENILYIFFNPYTKLYKSLIIKKIEYLNCSLNSELVTENDGINLPNCLDCLENNLRKKKGFDRYEY